VSEEARKRVAADIDAIEESYEFCLAYAAQGITKFDAASPLGNRLKKHLDKAAAAVDDLVPALAALLSAGDVERAEEVQTFVAQVEYDVKRAAGVLGLVRSRPAISSQLVDNLNASIHIRVLLTDLFLIDEVLKLGVDKATEPKLEPAS
jgi:hypothetical protein